MVDDLRDSASSEPLNQETLAPEDPSSSVAPNKWHELLEAFARDEESNSLLADVALAFRKEEASTAGSIENQLNEERLAQFGRFTSQVIQLVRDSTFEYGCETQLDVFLRDSLARNALATKEWLNDIFLKHMRDIPIVTGILRTLAHFDYEIVRPQGPTMAIAALAHKDPEVRECGIRAFENWESTESLEALENIQCDVPWLQEYLLGVVSDLRERFQNGVARSES